MKHHIVVDDSINKGQMVGISPDGKLIICDLIFCKIPVAVAARDLTIGETVTLDDEANTKDLLVKGSITFQGEIRPI
jgi:hypothetical protein